MDKYNLYCLLAWFAHDKIKHKKFYDRQFPEGYFRISLNRCDMHEISGWSVSRKL